jgi:hypothetical protein
MKPFDPFHISREERFDYCWGGDLASAYSPFFTDGRSIMDKRYLMGPEWFKILARPNVGDLKTRISVEKCRSVFETCIAKATIKWTIKGRDWREGWDCVVLTAPNVLNSCMIHTYKLITMVGATGVTEIYGQDNPKEALAFWRGDQPVGALMPFSLREDYQD